MVNQNPEQVARDKIRSRIYGMPPLNPDCTPARELGLRDCQERAIVNLERSLKENRPRALIQMATRVGKTFTAGGRASAEETWGGNRTKRRPKVASKAEAAAS